MGYVNITYHMAKYLPYGVYLRLIWNNASQSLVYEDSEIVN